MIAQMIRAGRLDRGFYTSLLFAGDGAVGDAALLVGVIHAIPAVVAVILGDAGIVGGLYFVLAGIVRWLLSAGGMHLVATKIYEVHGRYESAMRLAGFAQVASIPAALTILRFGFEGTLVLVSIGWLFATLYTVSQVLYDDLNQQQHVASAAGGAGAWFLALVFFG